MSVRKLGLVVAAICAALLIVPVTAGAQATPTAVTSLKSIPVTGKANGGKSFTGHFNVSQFVARGGKAYGRNHRIRRALMATLSEPVPPPAAPPGETAAEAIAVLDAEFPWLHGAEK